MEILGHSLSPKAIAFVREKKARIRKKLVFRNIKEHPFESCRSLSGAHGSDQHKTTIWIDPSGPHLDYTVAHEITHAVLEVEGFPTTARPKEYSNDEWTAYVGSMIQSIVLDPLVDGHLLLHNIIDPSRSDLPLRKIRQLKESYEQGQPTKYGPRFCLWVLDYVHAEIDPILSRSGKERLKSEIEMYFPRVKSVGEDLVRTIRNMGFKKPNQALKAMIAIRDALKLRNRCLVIDRDGKLY